MQPSIARLLEHDDFIVFEPNCVDIIEKAGEDADDARRIGGWCSTEALDRQNEIVVQRGLDFNEFVSFGHFNDNHKQGTAEVLGYPTLARMEKGRWWTEGTLLKDWAPADKIWDLAKAIKKSGTGRKLGFSIEGKVLERDGRNRILRALVRNVAITNCPVNTECTWEVLGKAFAPAEDVEAHVKALEAGHGMRVNGGAALRRESLESAEIIRNQDLSFDDAVALVQRVRPHLSKGACRRIVRYAMCR